MIGIVVVTHGDLARELVSATELILGKQDALRALPLHPDEDVDAIRDRLSQAIADVDSGEGVVILTDMFGGTPSNVALPHHVEGKVEVLMGVNLPMLLKLASARAGTDGAGGGEPPSLSALATIVVEHGRRNIQAATDVLRKK